MTMATDDIEIRLARLQERVAAMREATALQAIEYERRLQTLNHSHDKAIEVQHTYVTQDRYEDKIASTEAAFHLAVGQVNEKLDEHVKRYEERHTQLQEVLATMQGASREAARIAQDQARITQDKAAELAQKTSRTIGIAGLVLGIVIAIANGAGPF